VYIASVVMESVALYQTHHSASAAGLGFRALYGVNQKQESEVVDVEAAMYELEAPQPPGLPLAALRACGSLDDETMAARKSRRNELPGATNIASS
jgi:hypothetical protein